MVVDGGRGAAMMEPKGANDSRVRTVVDISISVEGIDGGILVCIDRIPAGICILLLHRIRTTLVGSMIHSRM